MLKKKPMKNISAWRIIAYSGSLCISENLKVQTMRLCSKKRDPQARNKYLSFLSVGKQLSLCLFKFLAKETN